MDFSNRKKCLIISVLFSFLSRPCLAIELTDPQLSLPPQKSADHHEMDKSKVSMSPTEEALPTSSESWFGHAAKSYSFWQQGNLIEAIREEESAVKLNPTNADLLINLAIMKQNMSAYAEAIDLYWRAARLAPNNWVAPIGIARCYILSGNESSGRKALQMMSDQNDCNFDWYYMIAKTWLSLNDLSRTEKVAKRAISVATKEEQKAAAQNVLFLVLLKSNKLDKAKALQDEVFHKDSPQIQESYIRAASAILPVNKPADGEDLLKCAVKNLTTDQDADAFLKLGRIFADKAADSRCADTDRANWLECAKTAYAQAIALNPKSPDYHLALAGIYSSKGDLSKTIDELKTTMSLERLDVLATFLVSKIENCQTTEQNHSLPLNLSLVKFKINGLTCSCHLSRVHKALRKIDGVAFISTPPKKPYIGSVLLDQGQTTDREMLAMCVRNYRTVEMNTDAVVEKHSTGAEPAETPPAGKVSSDKADPEKSRPEKLQLEMVSEHPVHTVDGALKIAQEIRFGPILSFQDTYADYFNRFREIAPIKPVNTDQNPGAVTATNWPAPL
jgi:tetratricopeptide (TPR) repeat protein